MNATVNVFVEVDFAKLELNMLIALTAIEFRDMLKQNAEDCTPIDETVAFYADLISKLNTQLHITKAQSGR